MYKTPIWDIESMKQPIGKLLKSFSIIGNLLRVRRPASVYMGTFKSGLGENALYTKPESVAYSIIYSFLVVNELYTS